ncbi:serine/threonine protein kinase [Coemansia sp. RSA 1365]|nr:serine/threonine protein kinase [Coemansia sp. RSA 1365]
MNAKTGQLSDSQEMEVLNQQFQRQLLVKQVPQSVWGVLLSLSPDDYRTVLLERTRPTQETDGTGRFGYHIGRHKSCDIRIQNVHISNRHCLIYRVGSEASGSRVFLEDTSTNGTFVNGQRVKRSAAMELQDGDEIQLVRYQAAKGMEYFNDRFYVFQNLDVHRHEQCEFKQSYLVAEALGKGAFAQVHVAINRVTGERFAVKMIDRRRMAERQRKLDENFRVETSILARVRHPAVVQVHGVFRERDFLYLVLDLAADGELFDEIVRREFLSEDHSRRVLLQLLLAIRHLNRMGIVHRDIKLENILLADRTSLRIKLADFGLAKIVGEQAFMKTVCGTPMYVAPEVLTVRQVGVYDKLVDMWSLGVVLYICLCGFPPFSDELAPPPMRDQIIAGMYSFPSPYWDTVSPEAIDLVCQMLQVDPRNRISVDAALAHPWLRACRTQAGWTIEGTDFIVADPDAADESQHTQSLSTASPLDSAPLHSNSPLPPSSPPLASAPVRDSGVIFTSVSDGEARGRSVHSTKTAVVAIVAGRKRKDPSFMRSQSDLGEMALPKRPMHVTRPQPHGSTTTSSPGHGSDDSGPFVLFEMSPDMTNPHNDFGGGSTGGASGSNNRNSQSCRPHRTTDGVVQYEHALPIHPKPIPRPGAPEPASKGFSLNAKTLPGDSGVGRQSDTASHRQLPTFFDFNGR